MVWSDSSSKRSGRLGRRRAAAAAESELTFQRAFSLPSRTCRGAAVDDHGDDIVRFAREQLGFVPEKSQVGFLQSQAKRGIVNCSRQWGKSTVAAIKAIHRAWTVPGCLVLVASPTERQSGEFLAKVRTLASSGLPIGAARGLRGRTRLSLRFPNGSRIVGLPGRSEANIRGFSAVSMLIIDEAARVTDALYRSLRPMLAVGNGDLWLLSTPNGRNGFFYEEFAVGGEQRWERIQVPATECAPRISGAFLEDEVAAMGAAYVRQEYLCEFVDTGGEMFDRLMVEEAFDESCEVMAF